MRKIPRCKTGNKNCGYRCVPESYTCSEDLQQVADSTSTLTTNNGLNTATTVASKPTPTAITSRSEAQAIQRSQQQQAYTIAGGKSAYKKELNTIIKDSGAGIKARITRDAMRVLAPNLIKADDLNLYLQTKKTGAYEKQTYNQDRSKYKMSDVVREGDVLSRGDIIRVRFPVNAVGGGFGYHYGVYLGNGRLIQYNKVRRENGKKRLDTKYAGVHEANLKDVNKAGVYKWEKVVSTNTYSPEELAARIDKVRDQKVKYNMMRNNCEHFSYLLTTGKAYSSQADTTSGPMGKIAELFFYYFQNRVLRKNAGLSDRAHDNDFKSLKDLKFSEHKVINNGLDPDFRYPGSIEEIIKELEMAKAFAVSVDQDPEVQLKVLSSWLQEYIYRLSE